MTRVRVESFTISLDSFGAGPHQDLDNPLGVGGTTFHFVTTGIHDALAQARAAANGQDVRIGGGVQVIQQFLRAGLVDEMHIAIAPVLLGSGERLFEGIDLHALGYACTAHQPSALATHVVFSRRSVSQI